jgi:hypothetical protein
MGGESVFKSPDCCSPTLLFNLRRVSAAIYRETQITPPKPETRNGLSLARNDIRTPLRGQRS